MNDTSKSQLMDSTHDLVHRARAGDRAAFDQLAEHFRARLERQIRARMGAEVRAKSDAEDILSETFARAYESIAQLSWEGEDAFYRWLAGIAENVIRNLSRKKGPDRLKLEREIAGADTSPSQNLRRHDRFDRLESALRQLSPDHRKVIVLARVEGLKMREIAEKMGKSHEAVKKLLARALVQLRRSFGETESLRLPDRKLDVGDNTNGV